MVSHHFISLTIRNIFLAKKCLHLPVNEIQERLIEFDVLLIKDSIQSIDFISLNSLFDFYKIEYNYTELKDYYNIIVFNVIKSTDSNVTKEYYMKFFMVD